MIHYSLRCTNQHDFDGWFRSSDDFDAQSGRKLLACPVCGSEEVQKRLMAPAVARTDRDRPPAPMPAEAAAEAPVPAPAEAGPVALFSEKERELRTMLRVVREHMIANADDVGDKFADVARAMHNEETERRSIFGRATADEVKELHEEGVEFSPLPVLPDEFS